jgi:hypothetical protein
MELHVTGELESKLTHLAAMQGRDPSELVQDVLTRYFEEETRFGERLDIRKGLHGKSGAALVEAMQASPYKDIELQPARGRFPVRDALL